MRAPAASEASPSQIAAASSPAAIFADRFGTGIFTMKKTAIWTIRAITLSARLVQRGTWRESVVFRQALCDPRRICLALSQRLTLLPAPAVALQLAVAEFGPAGGDQGSLLDGERTACLRRLQDAVSQVRALAGPNAALRAFVVDPRSRVPERTVLYAPWQQ